MRKTSRLRNRRSPHAAGAELISYLRYIARYAPVDFEKLLAPDVARDLAMQLGELNTLETRESRLLREAVIAAARKEGLDEDCLVAFFELLGRHQPREFLKLFTKL